jgi:hypothetical protein
MKDNALFIFLRSFLLEALPARGFSDVLVKQSYQPQQQGRASQSAVYLHKILDRRYGSRAVKEFFDKENGVMTRTEEQVIETTIQFNALASPRDPADDDEMTAADILKAVAACLQSPDFIYAGKEAGVQALRIQEIRNTPVQNDRDQFEFEPSFDAVFTHADVFTQTIESITHFKPGFNRV